MVTLRCTWDNAIEAGYVYFDGSNIGDDRMPAGVHIHESFHDDSLVVDCAEDGTVLGVELLDVPTAILEHDDGLLTSWHWFILGSAWQQMIDRSLAAGRQGVFIEWLWDAPSGRAPEEGS